MHAIQKITPCLWFADNAEEAVAFYVSIFDDAKILSVMRFGEAGPGPEGSVLSITFQLADQEFMALNGGVEFKFTEAISLFVNCSTQEEIDDLWAKLGAGGEEGQCGWLKDKFGLSWQIVPGVLGEMLNDEDAERSSRVTEAMLQMGKLDIQRLRQAYDGR
jgi:predicted 3-demethylubiquinone-9 3-methyltransferase (glyoxalase superfamily)